MITGRRPYPKWLVRGLVVFAIGMTALAAVASREHHHAENQRNAALSELVALRARSFESSDPALAMQLALVAYRLSQTTDARSALVDATAGEMPTRLIGRPGQTALALGDDGHRVAVAYQANGEVAIYRLRYAQLSLLATVPGAARPATIDAVALSDSGRLLAIGNSAGRVRLWDLASPAHPRQLALLHAGTAAVQGLSFSPGGGSLAAADADGSVQRWSLTDPAQPALAAALVAPGRPALEAVSYSHDGKTLAAVGAHGRLVVWPAHGAGTPLASDTLGTAALTAISYSPGGRTVAVGDNNGSVWLWKLNASGEPNPEGAPLLQADAGVTALAFSRDGRYLAAGTTAKSAPIWSTSDGQLIARLPHPATVTGLAFTDGDRRLLSTDAAGTTMIWQFPAPSTYTFGSALAGVTYSTTKPQLAVTLRSGHTDEWDVASEWRPAPAGAWYAAQPASPTTTTSTATAVVSPQAGDQALRRTQAQTTVTSSTLSDNGQLLAAGGSDDLVWLWDVSDPASPRLLAKLSGFTGAVTGIVFSRNSQTLFAGSADHTVRIWTVAKPTAPEELPSSPLIGPSTAITKLALSPDDRTLAVATVDGHVWLWSVATPSKASLSATLTAARDQLTALAFSPSDNVLVAGGGNRRLTFWHYRPYQAVNRICALAGTPITASEWDLYVPGAAYNPPCATWKPPLPPHPRPA